MTTHSLYLLTQKIIPETRRYQALIAQWNTVSNLIAAPDVKDDHVFSVRHVLDSAQLFEHIKNDVHIADVGAGAGFPGIILGLLSRAMGTNQTFHLVESREKRCLFLTEVKRQLALDHVIIHHGRVEQLPRLTATTFVSRAFRSLKDTIPLIMPHITNEVRYVALKGGTWEQEVVDAQRTWHFDLAISPSLTHSKSRVLHISHIKRRS